MVTLRQVTLCIRSRHAGPRLFVWLSDHGTCTSRIRESVTLSAANTTALPRGLFWGIMQTAATKPLPAIWRCEAAHAHASDCVPNTCPEEGGAATSPSAFAVASHVGLDWPVRRHKLGSSRSTVYDLRGRACDIIACRDGADESTSSWGLNGRTV